MRGVAKRLTPPGLAMMVFTATFVSHAASLEEKSVGRIEISVRSVADTRTGSRQLLLDAALVNDSDRRHCFSST